MRPGLVVFHFDNQWFRHDFEVGPARREPRMWETWLRQDSPLLFTGTYELTGDRLAIIGTFSGNVSPVQLELTRIQNR